MRAAIYARVSTEAQEARGTIGSQLAVLRQRVAAEGDELVAEFCDDGHSGARLDRPGLDALRDAAEAGLLDAVWCLSPDRLARVYAYQVIVLDELARHGVAVRFADAPAIDDDPQARLLTQVQGVIAEYERAKIAERYRRGKLWRSRSGEVIAWKPPYGYRRIPRSAAGPARLEVFEPEAAVVRRSFDDYLAAGHSMRQITRRLNADGVPSPTGKAVWGVSTLGRLLRNQAYIGRVYYNETESVPDPRPGRRSRQVPRPREEWIEIAVPAVVADDLFEAAGRVSRDNSKWSPRRAEPGQWLLRGLLKCGACGVGVNCHKMRGRNGTRHRYYYCRNHDPLRAGGEQHRCTERNIRSDALDGFVFDQVRQALLRPEVLLAGERAVATRAPTPNDELLAAQLARLERRAEAAQAERRRLVDLYQAGLIELVELQHRAKELDGRRRSIAEQHQALTEQRDALAKDNRLRQRIGAFAEQAIAALDGLDFDQRQQLLRTVVEEVRVTGWKLDIRLRIPLDEGPGHGPPDNDSPVVPPTGAKDSPGPMSSNDRLRSLGGHHDAVVQQPVQDGRGEHVVAEDAAPFAEGLVGGEQDRAALVAAGDQLEDHVGVGAGQRQISHLVEDQDGGLQVGLELLGEPPGGLGLLEVADQVVQGGAGRPRSRPGRPRWPARPRAWSCRPRVGRGSRRWPWPGRSRGWPGRGPCGRPGRVGRRSRSRPGPCGGAAPIA
jgi:site-specific DNA recombinase